MGQAADTIRGDKKITDPKMREALAKYAEAVGPDKAELVLQSVQRDQRSVAEGGTPRALASDLTHDVMLRPKEATPLIESMLGKEKAAAILKKIGAGTDAARESLEMDKERNSGFFLSWKPDRATVNAAVAPQKDALYDLRDAVQDALKTSMKPLATPATAASAPVQRGKH